MYNSGNILYLHTGKYPHQVKFKDPPKSSSPQKKTTMKDFFGTKRVAEEEAGTSNPKRQKTGISPQQSDEDSEQEEIRKKFEAFQNEMKQYPKPAESSGASASGISHSENRKSEGGKDDGDGGGKAKRGSKAVVSEWTEPDTKLLVYTAKGVCASSKVSSI